MIQKYGKVIVSENEIVIEDFHVEDCMVTNEIIDWAIRRLKEYRTTKRINRGAYLLKPCPNCGSTEIKRNRCASCGARVIRPKQK